MSDDLMPKAEDLLPEMCTPPKPKPPRAEEKERFSRPGHSDTDKRKPLPRGQPFADQNSLVKWSTR